MSILKQVVLGNYGSHGNIKNFVKSKLYNKYPYSFSQSSFPSSIEIELTNDCNLACPHCPRTSTMERDVGYMKFELITKIIKEVSFQSRTMIRIVGLGEPALHPRLKEILECIKKYNVKTEFTTNGELFERLSYDEIIDSGIDYIGVSIDGYDENSYNKRRIGGDYKTLDQHVKNFYKRRNLLNLKHPIIAIRNVVFDNDSEEKVLNYKKQWFNHSDVVSFNTYTPNQGVNYKGKYNRCTSIKYELKINWNGDVPLCRFQGSFKDEEIIANADDISIKDIWQNNEKLNRARNIHAGDDLNKMAYCKVCPKVQSDTPGIKKYWK